MKPICFYHKADLDGVCSAAIVKHFVPDCELYGIDYGEEFPWDLVRPGMDAETDPLWADCFKLENGQITYPIRTVYMVDFSLKPEDMKRLANITNLVWIDHHKTAINDCHVVGLDPRGMRSTQFAACEMTWTWCLLETKGNAMVAHGHCPEDAKFFPPPEAVRLLGVYDSWRKDGQEWDSKVMPFQYGCRALPGIYDPENPKWFWLLQTGRGDRPVITGPLVYDFPAFTLITQESVESGLGTGNTTGVYRGRAQTEAITQAGRFILYFQATQNQRIAEAGAFEAQLREAPGLKLGASRAYSAICLNTPIANSQAFDSVYDPEKHDLMVAFARMSNVRWFKSTEQGHPQRAYPWKVSLYSTKDTVDCGAIAKGFGGGGHKGAAGFVCGNLPWES